MKKIFLFSTLIGLFVSKSFCAVATTDVYVMNKDSQSASSAMKMAIDAMQQAQKAQEAATSSKGIVDAIQNFRKMDMKKFCPSCSDYTIQELQDWKNKNSGNLCEQLNDQLELVGGHMDSAYNIQSLLDKIKSISADPTDPNAMQSLNTAFASASSQTLTEMNQTQQQLAAYNLQKEQDNKVTSKISQMKMNKSMFGKANLCADDSSGGSSCN